MEPSGSVLVLVKAHVRPLQLDVKAATGGWFAGAGAGFRASAVANQECGEWKYQVHRGSTDPAFASTWYSASARIAVSATSVRLVKPAGGSLSMGPSTMLTP